MRYPKHNQKIYTCENVLLMYQKLTAVNYDTSVYKYSNYIFK